MMGQGGYRIWGTMEAAGLNAEDPGKENVYGTSYFLSFPLQCPPGSVVIPYDVPDNQNASEVDGYTCSAHSYFLGELQKGKTECRLKFYKDRDIPGSDVAAYSGLVNPYHEALRHCYINKCAEVACDGALTTCWLKATPAAVTGNQMVVNAQRNYWKVVCQ
ncbi:uncharacterized protein [Macrobrachium rosenbergii]|uniref:uncharacterized protein n=1 Tax=Macrobrachium rosenbergii TaxID=79674 RepID=UPI0034D5906D